MKRLLGLLLVMGMVGCGDPVAELRSFGAKVTKDEQGKVIKVSLYGTQVTDADIVHVKDMTKLQTLDVGQTPTTDAGLVYLKGLTNLYSLNLRYTQVTDAGIAELQKALPNCKITK